MDCDWDKEKDLRNRRKHGLSLNEAAELLEGTSDYLEIYDKAHSETEDRFIAVGPISAGIIVVVWTHSEVETTRIISARRATKREQALYHEHMDRRT